MKTLQSRPRLRRRRGPPSSPHQGGRRGRGDRPPRQEAAPQPQVTTVLSKPLPLSEILSEQEIAARKRDEDRQRALKDRQAADLRARQEREAAAKAAAEVRKAEEEARLRAEQLKRRAGQGGQADHRHPAHRPAKTEDKPAARDNKRAAPPGAPARGRWREQAPRRTEEDPRRGAGVTTGSNWRGAGKGGGRHGRHQEDIDLARPSRRPPSRSCARCMCPVTITVADLAHKIAKVT